LSAHLDEEALRHFEAFQRLLDELNVPYEVNPRLVRGLDYYNKTVFEWVTEELGAQGTLCAGGRYDGLVGQLGGRDTPAVGFAVGMERVLALCIKQAKLSAVKSPLLYLAPVGVAATRAALRLAETLREQRPWTVLCDCAGGNFKSQLKRADKSNAAVALVLGERETAEGVVGVKLLRRDTPQRDVKLAELVANIDQLEREGVFEVPDTA
jgi:histidyl-tRNA synthetase